MNLSYDDRTGGDTHVDRDELEHAILRQNTDDSLLACLVIPVDKRQPTRVRSNERGAGVSKRLIRVHRDRRGRRDIDRLLDFCVASELLHVSSSTKPVLRDPATA